jgi:MarR family transcriptional regulator, negative regulator of the multidrug operon emrRAB
MSNSKDARTANLLAAAVTGLDDAMLQAMGQATELDRVAGAALIALLDFTPAGSLVTLSRVVGLTHSGTVRLVDRLAALGYLERGAGPDARSRTVALTRSGRVVARRARRAREAAMSAALTDLNIEQREDLSGLCELLVGGLTRRRLDQRAAGSEPPAGALCRLCDFGACGRPQGTCPAANVVAGAR